MGTKYATVSVSGYNATPPDDDGTVSEANKVKWSTIKTKLPDPLKTAIESINTNLTTHFNTGPTALATSTAIDATYHNKVVQVSGSGVTLTLADAATLGAGWFCEIYNTDTSNSVTLARATSGDTLDGTAANKTIVPLESFKVFVIAAATGFKTSVVQTGQYVFPATQKASTDVNTLDDYEEGTWTPSLGGDTTYTNQAGEYIKIGRLVFVQCYLVINSIGTGSTISVYGLPFTSDSTQGNIPALTVSSLSGSATSVVYVVGQVQSNATHVGMKSLTAAATQLGDNAIFANSTNLVMSGHYMAAA